MEKGWKKLFQKIGRAEPPDDLFRVILLRIEKAKIRAARVRLVFSASAALASLVILIPAFQYTAQGFSNSGFYQYLSLLFSDSNAILLSWKEFMLSLAESLPVIELATLLLVILAVLSLLRLAAKNIKTASLLVKFT